MQLERTLDRTGVFASVFCAIHCAAAPALMLAAPALGSVWSHPISHLAIAAIVLPVAIFALRTGLRQHGRRWVLHLGVVGIALVLVGAILPYLSGHSGAGCENCDNCCPSFLVDEATGEKTLHVPPASIVTLIGGIALVTAHMANLRCCAGCKTSAIP